MKYLKFAFIFSLISIFLLSCQKEKLEEDISINAQMHENIRTAERTQQTAAFTAVGIRNPDLVSNFYNDMIGLQESTRFYDDLYETHGYMDWLRAVEYQVEEGGHILVVPVHQEENGSTNGVFLYFDSGDEQKVTFYTRTELDQKVALGESSRLNNDEIFAYRNLALHELRKKGWSEDFTYDLRTVLGGDEEEGGGGPTEGGPTEGGTTEGPECEGGSFQWVCAFIPADSGAEGIDASVINTYIDNNYGHGAAIRDQFDGYSFFELRDNFDQILGNIWAGHRESFLEYFNDRESLYNNTGLGNGSDGILIGTIETLIRECAWIWVWCWQDPFDLELNLGGGGGGSTGPYVEPWEDDYNRLRFCEGVYDLHDTGPDNPDMIHPDYDYCIIWMEYLNDCIIPNLPSTYNQPGYPTYADYIEQWAQIQEFEPELFAHVISGTEGCIPTGEIDDYITEHYERIECNNALRSFEDTYDLELSKNERRAIWTAFEEDEESPTCGDQEAFEEWVLFHMFIASFSKKEGEGDQLDLAQFFSECFGSPDADGNYIDCNSTSTGSSFSLTLYAEQPISGDRSPFSGNPITGVNVGHTFLSLSSTISGEDKNVTYGFYPSEAVDLDDPNVAPAIYDDGNHEYTSSVTIELTCEAFNQALNNSIALSEGNYDLGTNNCTDFGINVANSVGLGVEDTTSDWMYLGETFGSSSNPGDLGEDIKLLTEGTINSSGGTSPTTNCE